MKHLKSLDSLRGLACLSVFICHATSEAKRYQTFNILASGNEAVILFFVLSGFVLTMSYERDRNFKFLSYVVKRIFRIYPAYYCAILLLFIFDLYSNNTRVYNNTLVLHSILLFPQTNHTADNLIGPSWSLAYEVIISIAVMPLFWRIKKNKLYLLWLTTILILYSLIIGYFIHIPSQMGFPISNKLVGVPFYSTFFALGIVLYEFRRYFVDKTTIVFLIISTLLYINFYISFHFGSLVLTAIGSCGIIMCAIYNVQIKKILEHKILLFYGEISFSFYIMHKVFMDFVPNYLPNYVYPKSLITFIVVTMVSWLSYKYVERPFMKVCRLAHSKMKCDL